MTTVHRIAAEKHEAELALRSLDCGPPIAAPLRTTRASFASASQINRGETLQLFAEDHKRAGTRARFPRVLAAASWLVGLGGLESLTSSLSVRIRPPPDECPRGQCGCVPVGASCGKRPGCCHLVLSARNRGSAHRGQAPGAAPPCKPRAAPAGVGGRRAPRPPVVAPATGFMKL
jgi:hypothetical protein